MNKASAVVALCLISIIPAVTAGSFDPATGEGFVSRGAVQSTLGFNNDELQAAASSLTFAYVDEDVFQITKTWTTGTQRNLQSVHVKSRTTTVTTGMEGSLSYEMRLNPNDQVTGFWMTGYSVEPTVWTANLGQGGDTVIPLEISFTDPQGNERTLVIPTNPDDEWYRAKDKALDVQVISSTKGLFVNGLLINSTDESDDDTAE